MRSPNSNYNNGFKGLETKQQAAGGQADTNGRLDRQDRGTDEAAALDIEGRGQLPGWQSAFVLGPNVRFTRTPDTAMNRRNAHPTPTEPTVTASQPDGHTSDEPVDATMAVAPKSAQREASSASQSREAALAKPGYLPQPPDAVGARALTYRLRRELARAEEQAAQQANRPAATTPPALTPPSTASTVVPELVQAAVDRSRMAEAAPAVTIQTQPGRVTPVRATHAWLQPSSQITQRTSVPRGSAMMTSVADPATLPKEQNSVHPPPARSLLTADLLSTDACFEAMSLIPEADDPGHQHRTLWPTSPSAPRLDDEPFLGKPVVPALTTIPGSVKTAPASMEPVRATERPLHAAVRPEVVKLPPFEADKTSVVALYRQVEAQPSKAPVRAPDLVCEQTAPF